MPETMRCLSAKLAVLPPPLWQQHAVWVCFSGADLLLPWVLEELDPVCVGRGQVRLKVGSWGPRAPQGSAAGHALAILLHQWDQALR